MAQVAVTRRALRHTGPSPIDQPVGPGALSANSALRELRASAAPEPVAKDSMYMKLGMMDLGSMGVNGGVYQSGCNRHPV